jgi:hypothetical protein
MKKVLFITDGKGGAGKTLIAHHGRPDLKRLRYPRIFCERTLQRIPRPKAKRPSRIKHSTVIFRHR